MSFADDYSEVDGMTVAEAVDQAKELFSEVTEEDPHWLFFNQGMNQFYNDRDRPFSELNAERKEELKGYLQELNSIRDIYLGIARSDYTNEAPKFSSRNSARNRCLAHARSNFGLCVSSGRSLRDCEIQRGRDEFLCSLISSGNGNGKWVSLFADMGFKGQNLILGKGRYDDLRKLNFDRKLSSFKQSPTTGVTLFPDLNFGGVPGDYKYRYWHRDDMRAGAYGDNNVRSIIVY
ncbi:hypothetical protein GTA62_14740 [Roseobacter sp. HKCCD9010]|uniref:hypothetical protein n=1 Tax=unclassified Roseobacter TaxID=196798 RepID=UPI001491C51E|nr:MULTISPECIES: hypothetical protein [unclassified Roseobacter]MBF9050632.1 hypothetical protein [Rhodobacterales bacterium HKCCD4356]NNV11950.1 hypothetical protein [Roseobacter sp. HKCCD7357]NNV16963.1 hypothetical protein [Roseobacter sp. HKCCD8768]NNV26192.1 hypothetical protein [Roseobacter sp. HKCCD8192]NNV30687.1 hypothetical protein [Roseobacter sp. HKCCD9061]